MTTGWRVHLTTTAALATVVLLAWQSPVAAAPQWYDGPPQYSTITNCGSIIFGNPYQEKGAAAWVGQAADLQTGQPSPNQVYYVHVFVYGLGNSCSGQRFFADFSLPMNTSLAIDATNQVLCFGNGQPAQSDCPQSLPNSSWNPGSYAILSPDSQNAYTWPLPQGGNWEFRIPVRTSTAISGSQMQANVWMLDGNSSPWLRPTQGIYVFDSSAPPPTPVIQYQSPSTINIQTTTARSEAILYTYNASITGTGHFDLGTTASYGLIHEAVTVPGGSTGYLAWDQWDPILQPDTEYHWRFTFTPTGGSTIFGADQTFRTLPDGRVTVGTGTAASCSEAAFNTAFNTSGVKSIVFACGGAATTITLTTSHTITPPMTTLTIDGGSNVTLARSGNGNHFTVQNGATLALKGITLSNAFSPIIKFFGICGGSITVAAGGTLTTTDARFIANQASLQGGAICNSGTASVTNTVFSQNTTLSSHGGAIGNYGTITITNSRFFDNRAAINGGAIDTVGQATVTDSTFGNNVAGFRGGAINTFVGSLNIASSSFLGNAAGLYGGGLASDGSQTTVITSTFAANSSNNFGGGIEISGDGYLALQNSTVTDNTAVTEGGGVYWTAGATAPFNVLNTTIADNTAGTTGGNIYTGAAGGPVNALLAFRNTIVAGGIPGNCSGPASTAGFNLENTNTCAFNIAGDKTNVPANLGVLQTNGGTTMTRLPQPGSQAIDGGTDTGCLTGDQHGRTRPLDGDGNGAAICDIGATEVLYPAPTITRVLPDGGPTAGGQTVTITGTNLAVVYVTVGGVNATVSATTNTTATVTTPAHAAGAVDVRVATIFGQATAAGAYTYFPLVAPASMTATATSTTAVSMSWPASGEPGSVYEVWRSSFGTPFSLLVTTSNTSANDTGLSPNSTYLYKVRVVIGANTSGFSPVDAATTVVFADANLAGMPINAIHLTQLRTAVNAMRLAAGLPVTFFTEGTVTPRGTAIKRLHIMELRNMLNATRAAIGLPLLTFAQTITARSTVITPGPILELRAGTQ